MKKENYTAEQILIDAAKALSAKKDTAAALSLDQLLLEMEEKQGLMDGMPVEVCLL